MTKRNDDTPPHSPTRSGNVTSGIWISYLQIVWASFVLGPCLVSSLSPNSGRDSFFPQEIMAGVILSLTFAYSHRLPLK